MSKFYIQLKQNIEIPPVNKIEEIDHRTITLEKCIQEEPNLGKFIKPFKGITNQVQNRDINIKKIVDQYFPTSINDHLIINVHNIMDKYKKKLKNYVLEDRYFTINDTILYIEKQTREISDYMIVLNYDENTNILTIKKKSHKSNKFQLTINVLNYLIFKKK